MDSATSAIANANDINVAIVGAVALLIGALIALGASLLASRVQARSALNASARPSIERLQATLAEFQVFAVGGFSITRKAGDGENVLRDEWSKHSDQARRDAERISWGKARKALRVVLITLDRSHDMANFGLLTMGSIQQQMWWAATDGFDLASASLREGGLSHGTMLRVRRLHRQHYWLFQELNALVDEQDGKPVYPTGVVRQGWRALRRKNRAALAVIMKPFSRVIGYLFRP